MMFATPRLPSPPTDVLRRGEARLLARLPELAPNSTSSVGIDDPTQISEAGLASPSAVDRSASEHERYVFGDVFASGGLGVVRRGEDRRLGRAIAIKELRRDGAMAQQRFALEAAITARLQHPGIVPLYDLGWQDSGEPFYCMKLVDGESLEVKIQRAPNLAARLRLLEHVVAVADAIAYAHEQRIVHRDLKPANVLVGRFGETVVIDWGLAKDLSGRIKVEPIGSEEVEVTTGGPSDMTEAGTVMGTLRYMPPEQAAGEPVDVRSDVYALGAILYHVLAGVPPFARTGGRDLVLVVLEGALEDLRQRDPAIPRELAAIAHRAMARDPAARYASAGAFAEDIRRFLAGRLVSAHAYSLREIAGLWLRRHRVAVGITAASIASLAVFGVFAQGRIADQRALAEQAERAAVVEAERADRSAFERATTAEAERAGEVLRLARTGREREALVLGVQVLARHADDLEAAPRVAVDGLAHALSAVFPVATLASPDHPVYSARFSPDGSLIATYPWSKGPDDRIVIRSTDSLEVVATLPSGDNPLGYLAFSPDGRRLAVSGEERCVVWDIASRAKQLELAHCTQPFFSTDGSVVFGKQPRADHLWGSRQFDGLAAWSAEDGALRWRAALPGLEFGALVHPDGERLVIKRDQRLHEQIELLAVDSGATLATLSADGAAARYKGDGPIWASNAFALSHDGRHAALVEAAEHGHVLVWDLEAQKVRDLGPVQSARWRRLEFSRDGQRLIAHGGGLDVFDLSRGTHDISLPGSWSAAPLRTTTVAVDGDSLWRIPGALAPQELPPGQVRQLGAPVDGEHFATVTASDATLWSTRDMLALSRWTPPPGEEVVGTKFWGAPVVVGAAAEVVTRDADNVMRLHDRHGRGSPLVLGPIPGRDIDLWSAGGGVWRRVSTVVDEHGSLLSVNRLSFLDRRTGAVLFAHDDVGQGFHDTAVPALRASIMAAATAEGAIDVIDAAAGTTVCTIPSDGAAMEAVTLSERGDWVAGLRKTGALVVWDVAACRETAALRPFTPLEVDEQLKYLRTIEFADDGSLAFRYRMRTVVIDPRTGDERLRVDDPCLPGQPWGGSILSPDGRHLLTACQNDGGKAWLWDVEGGAMVAELDLDGRVGRPRFSRSGDVLALRTDAGQLTVLDTRDGRPRFDLRARVRIEQFSLRDDGSSVDVVGDDGVVYTYPLTRGGLLAGACRALAGTEDAAAVADTCAGLVDRSASGV